MNPAVLEVGNFQIKPAFFEINAGSIMTLEVVFTPHNEEDYSEEIVMVCDNCQVKYFTLEGLMFYFIITQICLFVFFQKFSLYFLIYNYIFFVYVFNLYFMHLLIYELSNKLIRVKFQLKYLTLEGLIIYIYIFIYLCIFF